MVETQPNPSAADEILRVHKQTIIKTYIAHLNITTRSLGDNPQKKAVFEYGKGVAQLMAATTSEAKEHAFEVALERQTALLKIADETVHDRVNAITDAAQEFFPHDPHITVFGLAHDLSQFTHASTIQERARFRNKYITNYVFLIGRNDTEIYGLVSQVHAAAVTIFSPDSARSSS